MGKGIFSVSIERSTKYHDIDHDIYDEDYKKEITLLKWLKFTRFFTLRNDISEVNKRTTSAGFKKS